jgi:hypothetical protein
MTSYLRIYPSEVYLIIYYCILYTGCQFSCYEMDSQTVVWQKSQHNLHWKVFPFLSILRLLRLGPGWTAVDLRMRPDVGLISAIIPWWFEQWQVFDWDS